MEDFLDHFGYGTVSISVPLPMSLDSFLVQTAYWYVVAGTRKRKKRKIKKEPALAMRDEM